jgi:hypothetical protein
VNPTPSDYLEWQNEEIHNKINLNVLQIDYLIVEIIDENPETLENIIIGKGFTSIDHIVGSNLNRNISFKMKIMKVEEGRSRRGSVMSVYNRRNSRRRSSTKSRRNSTKSRRESTKGQQSVKAGKEEEVKGKESKKSEKKEENKVTAADDGVEEGGEEDGDDELLEGDDEEEEEIESKEDENLFASLLFDMCASISFTPVTVHPNDPSEQEHNNKIIAEENKCQIINIENNFGKFSLKPSSTNNDASSSHFRLLVSELRGDVWNLTKKLTGDYATSMILTEDNQVKSLKVRVIVIAFLLSVLMSGYLLSILSFIFFFLETS